MTDSEAIEKLRAYHKCRILQVKGIYEDCNEKLCDNCDLCYAQGNAGEHIKSIEVAINALEKQIAKKSKTDDRYVMYICPCCNDFIKVSHNYCQNCGQKLDWSDEE